MKGETHVSSTSPSEDGILIARIWKAYIKANKRTIDMFLKRLPYVKANCHIIVDLKFPLLIWNDLDGTLYITFQLARY